MKWTEERETQLRELRDQGFTFKQVATKLGMTRGAVAGRVRDLRLSVPEFSIERPPTPLPMRQVASVTLFDLEPHHCRWPVSDAPYMFCGDTKIDGSSYCRHHFGMSKREVAA